jgi:hypothetical protein
MRWRGRPVMPNPMGWSFWSKPFRAHYAPVWSTPRNHALAWVASVQSAARHYPDTMPVTDSAGARMLVDRLGLRFSEGSTCLDQLLGHDPGAASGSLWFRSGGLPGG